MCIAIAKIKNVATPSMNVFKNSFINNPDGAGIAVCRDGSNKVEVIKGLMTFKEFKKTFHRLRITRKDSALFHFRIGTAGSNSMGNCHPFPLEKKASALKKLYYTTDLAMVHNGILTVEEDKEQDFSDTQTYIAKTLAASYVKDNLFTYPMFELIEDSIGYGNKFAFIKNNGVIFLMGTGWTMDKGIHYSNTTYKERKTHAVDCTSYTYYTYEETPLKQCPECKKIGFVEVAIAYGIRECYCKHCFYSWEEKREVN